MMSTERILISPSRTQLARTCARAGWNTGRAFALAIGLVVSDLLVGPARSGTPPTTQTPTVTSDSLSLGQVIAEVISRNDRVAAARFMEEAAARRVGPAGSWDDPVLTLGLENFPPSLDLDEDPMTMKVVGLRQAIPYSGFKGLQAKSVQADANATVEERRTTESELATAAKIAYYDVYYRERVLSELEKQRRLLEQIVESSTAKLRANQAGQDEVLAAQADLWRLEPMLMQQNQEIESARYELNALRGTDPAGDRRPLASLVAPVPPETAEEWLSAASANYPPLKKLDHQAESYALSAEAAGRMQWPMLELGAAYGFRADGEMEPRDDMITIEAMISLPVFAGRKQGDMALSMAAMEKGARAEAVQRRRDVERELLALHDRARVLSESLRMYRERVIPTAEDAYRSALAGYINNRTSFIAVLAYAQGVYRDRVTAIDLEAEVHRTLAQAEMYTTSPDDWGADRKEDAR